MWRCAVHFSFLFTCGSAVSARRASVSSAAVDLMQNNWAKYTGGAIHLSYCNGVQASFPSNTFIGEARHVCSCNTTLSNTAEQRCSSD